MLMWVVLTRYELVDQIIFLYNVGFLTTSTGGSNRSRDKKSATKEAQPSQVKSSVEAVGAGRRVIDTNF